MWAALPCPAVPKVGSQPEEISSQKVGWSRRRRERDPDGTQTAFPKEGGPVSAQRYLGTAAQGVKGGQRGPPAPPLPVQRSLCAQPALRGILDCWLWSKRAFLLAKAGSSLE